MLLTETLDMFTHIEQKYAAAWAISMPILS